MNTSELVMRLIMSELTRYDFNKVIIQLQNYGKEGSEEIAFQEKDGQLIPVATEKPNWFFRLVRWLFQGGYQETNVVQKIVNFLDANMIHVLEKKREINTLRDIFLGRIKEPGERRVVEERFDSLISQIYAVAKKNQAFIDSVSEKENKPSPSPEIKEITIPLKTGGGTGQYEYNFKKKPVSSGANGDIFFGKEKTTGKEVAIKVAKGFGIEDLKVEVPISEVIGDHPNFVKFFGYSATEGILVMEKADSAMNKKEVLDPATTEEKKKMIVGFIEGVQHLHSKKLTHNDINLKNLLIKDGQIKICDLGSSRNYSKSDNVKIKLSEDLQQLYDLGFIHDNDLIKSWKDSLNGDIKDTLKAIYNILVSDPEDEEIPANFAELLKAHCSDLRKEDLAILEGIFKKYREHKYDPDSLTQIRELFQAVKI